MGTKFCAHNITEASELIRMLSGHKGYPACSYVIQVTIHAEEVYHSFHGIGIYY